MSSPLSTETRVDRIMHVRQKIGEKLDEISKLYRDRVKITLVVRAIDYPDGKRDTVMTEDEPEKAIAALRKLINDPNAEHYDDTGRADQQPDDPEALRRG